MYTHVAVSGAGVRPIVATAWQVDWLATRAYDPSTGRFLARDPLGRAPLFFADNPYTYAGNNPVSNVDPSGQYRAAGAGSAVRESGAATNHMMARVVAKSGTPSTGAPVTKSTTRSAAQVGQVTTTVAQPLTSQVPRGKILPCVPDTRVTWQWWGSTTFFSECDIQIMNNWITFGYGVISAVAAACAYWADRCVKAFMAVGVAVTVSQVGDLATLLALVAGAVALGYVAWIDNDDQACYHHGVFIDHAFSPPGATWIDSVC